MFCYVFLNRSTIFYSRYRTVLYRSGSFNILIFLSIRSLPIERSSNYQAQLYSLTKNASNTIVKFVNFENYMTLNFLQAFIPLKTTSKVSAGVVYKLNLILI